MRIECEITEQDYVDFNLYHFSKSKEFIKSRLVILVLCPALFAFITFNFSGSGSMFSNIIRVVLFAVIWIIFYPIVQRSMLINNVKKLLKDGKNKDLLGRHEFVFDEEGIIERTENAENRAKWAGIEKIVETKKAIYLYNSSVSAYIIPSQSFEKGEILAGFVEYLHKIAGK
ncbi:MAG: YcxB family protein [Bacillota bacterium]